MREVFGDRVDFHTLERDLLEVDQFDDQDGWTDHFRAYYGPTIVAEGNAERDGRQAEFDEALRAFGEEWNLGSPDDARFEQEYLIAVGTRR